jgi:hypothetical protein
MQSHLSKFSLCLGTVLALAGMATADSQPALAQPSSQPCHLLTSTQSIPPGVGAAYNLFSAARELLLDVECGVSSDATLTVGNGQDTTYVYRLAYEWVNGAWRQIALGGQQLVANEWYIGTARANLSRSQAQLAEDNFVVAYTCLWQDNSWKCGCRDTACATNYWQLQAFRQARTGPDVAAALQEEVRLPPANNTLNAEPSNFDSVYASAAAGNHIVLANGKYGSKTLNRTFPSGNRLVVRAQNLLGATFSTLTVSGGGQIVSGVTIDRGATTETGAALYVNASNVRVTRSVLRNGATALRVGRAVTDVLLDHCETQRSRDRMFILDDPKDQQRITIARCWVHELLAGGSMGTSHAFAWADENGSREKHHDIVVRLNYIGPGLAPQPEVNSDWVHHKGSKSLYAFNRFDTSGLLSHRFGLRTRSVGNYGPNASWYFGNDFSELQAGAGRSAYYDDTRNRWQSVGGFHATKRTRIAGNSSRIVLGFTAGAKWCTSASDATLPDAQPAGGIKPARSFEGVNYAADLPDDPDVGIKIRAHSGSITELTDLTCIDGGQVQNLSSSPSTAAPDAWLTELLAEYPLIERICPNPTSLTGGPGGSAPWSVAQGLTRGDAGAPNTGPFRNSPGGLP